MRTQPGLGGRGVYPPRTKGPNSSRLAILGVDSPPSSPFFAPEGSLPPLPRGLGSCARTPGVRWGVGEGRGGGGGSSKRDTKRRPSASAPWRRWGGGRAHPILPSPPAGLGTSAATHLGPAYLSWGRGDAAAGGLGAVSVSVVSPARGAQGATIPGRDEKGAARGSVAPVLELSVGVPEASCW